VAWLPSIFTKRMVIPWSHMIDEVHLNRRSVEQYIGARIIKIKKRLYLSEAKICDNSIVPVRTPHAW
jgi:hypothetical protein